MSGKSYYVKKAVIPKYKCLVFDPNGEYNGEDCDFYKPKKTSYPGIAWENEKFLDFVKKNKGEWDLVIWDEADSIFPNKKPLMSNMDNLKGKYRHESEWGGIGIIFLMRRPAQIFTDFPSLSHYIFTFGSKGASDIQRLNAEAEGLGDQSKLLANYEYIVVSPDRSFKRMPKI